MFWHDGRCGGVCRPAAAVVECGSHAGVAVDESTDSAAGLVASAGPVAARDECVVVG